LFIGTLFLWRNLHPEAPVFDLLALYWPFVLIAWGLVRLIEVLVWHGEGCGSGFTGGEVVLVVLICIAGSGMWEAHQHGIHWNVFGPDWLGEQYDYPVSAHGAAGGMNRVVFENPRGNIKVTGGDAQEVTVSGHKLIHAYAHSDADRTNEKTPVEVVPQGDRLLVRTSQDRAPDNQRISDDLEVTVPRGMAVEARGRAGDYEISDIAGDVVLTSDRGDVRLARVGGNARVEVGRSDVIRALDVKGKIDVQGRGSDIELENIAGQVTINGGYTGTVEFKNLAKPLQFEGARSTELSVQAVPGRISMDMGEFTARDIVGPVRLVTQSRDIKIEQFTQSLELETQRGDIELQPARLPLYSIEAHSGTGRIDLVLPEKAAFQLQATAERGEAVNDFGPQIQKEVEGRTATLKGKVGEGPTIHLTASRGSVSVRKEGTLPSASDPAAPPQPPKAPKNLKETEIEM
jgi:hypothetical protein